MEPRPDDFLRAVGGLLDNPEIGYPLLSSSRVLIEFIDDLLDTLLLLALVFTLKI